MLLSNATERIRDQGGSREVPVVGPGDAAPPAVIPQLKAAAPLILSIRYGATTSGMTAM